MLTYRFPFHAAALGALGSSADTGFNHARPSRVVRNEVLRAIGQDVASFDGSGFPRADAREDATGFTVQLDVPGIAPQGIEVLAEDQLLLVRGSTATAELADGERQLFAERSNGSFERRWRFPKSADLHTIAATYLNGVLTLRIAKVEPAQPRKVPVTVSAA